MSKAGGTTGASDFGWLIFGVIFAWAVVLASFQQGIGGYLRIFAAMFAIDIFLLLYRPITRFLWTYRGLILAPLALVFWISLTGSYWYARDLAMTTVSTLVTLLAFPSGRIFLLGMREKLRGSPVANISIEGWGWRATSWLLLSWFLISGADRIGESTPVVRRGNVIAPASMPGRWSKLHVGLALSGGGYRAAVMHAGVLDQLGTFGVPITNLSTVSGGSIIGAFIAAGGSPRDFADAVTNGRFRYKRDLTWIWNVVRLPAPAHIPWLDVNLWPFGSFSRLDVQQELVDRVLLGGVRADDAPKLPGPQIVLNMTDLRYGFSVGLKSDGMFLMGPVAADKVQQFHEGIQFSARNDLPPAFYQAGKSIDLEPIAKLSRRVALSGAFPGAFPVTELAQTIPVPQMGQSAPRHTDLKLALADGGIRDNLGLNVLELADLLARLPPDGSTDHSWNGDAPDAKWRLDVILISDGGKALQASDELSTIGSVFRAIDLNGLETGALRRLSNDGNPPIELLSGLSSLSFSPDEIAYGYSTDELRDNPSIFLARGLVNDETLLSLVELTPN